MYRGVKRKLTRSVEHQLNKLCSLRFDEDKYETEEDYIEATDNAELSSPTGTTAKQDFLNLNLPIGKKPSPSFSHELFISELISWANHENISHKSFYSLLKILKEVPDLKHLPSDSRKILKTPRNCNANYKTTPSSSSRQLQFAPPSPRASDEENMEGGNWKAYSTRQFNMLKSIALRQSEQLSHLITQVSSLKESISSLKESRITSRPSEEQDEGMDTILLMLPLSSTEEVTEFELLLEADENAAKVAKFLAKSGGTSVQDTTTRILRLLFTNSVASEYSWLGMKQKKVFSTLKLKEIVFSAVRRNKATISATDKEIEMVARNWLRNAKTRQLAQESSRAKRA